jgi:hypothetical protein
MNFRERVSLDRYITGDYGERQFRGQEEEMAEEATTEKQKLLTLKEAADELTLAMNFLREKGELNERWEKAFTKAIAQMTRSHG